MSPSRSYYRIMLGPKSSHAEQCIAEGWFGGSWSIEGDLKHALSGDLRAFNTHVKPIYFAANPDASKVAAGLACGMLFTICKGIEQGDIVLCPDGLGNYRAGTVASDYYYAEGDALPHRRRVEWIGKPIPRSDMSEALQRSTGSIGTVSNISKHYEEIEQLLAGHAPPDLTTSVEGVEDPSVFALEKHLEDFLIQNWASTELGADYDIFEVDGEAAGQQYLTDTGPIDILAIRRDNKELMVVELKKGRASDIVVGQVQRYMGYVLDELAEPDQTVRGCIIALENDLRLQRALRVTANIDFYRYEVSFKLIKGIQ